MTRWTIHIAGLLALAMGQASCAEQAEALTTGESSPLPVRGELLTASLPEQVADPDPQENAGEQAEAATKTIPNGLQYSTGCTKVISRTTPVRLRTMSLTTNKMAK